MKHLFLLSFLLLASCSLFQAGTADYDRDGLISDAEYEQFNKEKEIEAEEIKIESMKRREIANAIER